MAGRSHPLFQEMTAQTRAVAIALHKFRNERTRWRGQTIDDILDQQAAQDFPASFNEITRASGISPRKVKRTVALFIRLGLIERTFRGNSRLRSDGRQQYQQANRYRLPRWSEEMLDAVLEVWRSLPFEGRCLCGFRKGSGVTVTQGVVSQEPWSRPLGSVTSRSPR